MAKEKSCHCEQPAEIPAWFMTYSDVITLLMTFFILLLTFATNEPEHFARMQIAMFGGGSSSGLAGKNNEPFDKNAMLMRARPTAARLTIRGSEMPPVVTDPAYESLDAGVKSLENSHELADADRMSIRIPLSVVLNEDDTVTAVGQQQLRMIATQMRRMPIDVRLEVRDLRDADRCLPLATELISSGRVAPSRVSIGTNRNLQAGDLRLSLIRTKAGIIDG